MSDKKETQPGDKDDKELSDLLNSALEDFGKTESTDKTKDVAKKEAGASSAPALPESFNSEDFIQQAASQFEQSFANLLAGGDPNAEISPEFLQQKLQQMAEAAKQVLDNPTQVTNESTDIGASITQAIQGLNAGAEGLQNPFNEDDLMKMFGNPQGGTEEILPFMQGMMQGLLSKEVLGPSLQSFVDKLPQYLEENKDKISAEDKQRYEDQKKLMEEVLEELNKEKDTDSPEQKKERFTTVLEKMQKLQDFGQPPPELVGDVDTPFNFDPSGNPLAGAEPADCVLM